MSYQKILLLLLIPVLSMSQIMMLSRHDIPDRQKRVVRIVMCRRGILWLGWWRGSGLAEHEHLRSDCWGLSSGHQSIIHHNRVSHEILSGVSGDGLLNLNLLGWLGDWLWRLLLLLLLLNDLHLMEWRWRRSGSSHLRRWLVRRRRRSLMVYGCSHCIPIAWERRRFGEIVERHHDVFDRWLEG